MRPPGAPRDSERARASSVALVSTAVTAPRRPTRAARSRTTTPVPQPTSSTRSPVRTGTQRRKRRRRRTWLGVRPRTSRAAAIVSAVGCASTARQGSGWRLANVTARALLAAEVGRPVGAAAAHGPRAHDVRLADGILHQLVADRDPRPRPLRERTAQEREQHGEHEHENRKEQYDAHRLPLRLDGEGPKEFLVLRGQLGREPAALGAREEDTGVGAAPEDLLDGVARGVGGRQRGLDRLHEALEESVEMTLSGHQTLTITYGACALPGPRSRRRSAGRGASSRCARTAGGCPTATTSSSSARWCRWRRRSAWRWTGRLRNRFPR